jgi:hypothetical protein
MGHRPVRLRLACWLWLLALPGIGWPQAYPYFPPPGMMYNSDTGGISLGPVIGTNPSLYGQNNTAVECSFVANSTHPAQVMGFTTPSQQASYPTYDNVSCYMDVTAQIPIAVGLSGAFTATTFVPATPLSDAQVTALRVGMFIKTGELTAYYGGQISSFASDGTSITVSGWFLQGNTAAGQIPPNTETVIINPNTKDWVINGNCIYPASGTIATACAAIEMGLVDNSASAATNTNWMYDAVNLTSNTSPNNVAHICRALWGGGCFVVLNTPGGPGFASYQTSGNVFQEVNALVSGYLVRYVNYNVDYSGYPHIGSTSAVNTAQEFFLSSGSGLATADATVSVSGGSGANDGTYNIAAAGLQFNTNPVSTAVGASPTGTIGLSAVAGSSGNYTRSDGTAALSQAIIPNWTGTHTFSGNPNRLDENAAAGTNQKYTVERIDSGGSYIVASATDATPGTSVTNLFAATRSGTAWTGLTLGNATDATPIGIPGALAVVGNATVGGSAVCRANGTGCPNPGYLTGTSASLGGSALLAGACSTNATTVTGATVGMAVVATPSTFPGAGANWEAYVSAANTVTTAICAVVALTPTASVYNLRVLQ